jgi:TPP-dependent 2-oxoacid decarboxylase
VDVSVDRTAVGELLLGRLRDLGVRHVFGLPGDYNMEFLDQIQAFPGVDWVGSCNELNAAYAADGYARLAGIGAMVSTFGAGELSAVNGLAGAMAESVPVVSIVGGPTTAVMRHGAAVHHSLGDGDFRRWLRIAREVTVAQTILTADNAAAEIDRVLRECWLQQRPVYILLPGDVARQPVPGPATPLARPEPIGSDSQLDAFTSAAQRLLGQASRPAMLVGNLAIRYGLGAEVASFLADRNWPAATQTTGRGLLDETSPHYLGIYNGGESANTVRDTIEGSDVLVCVGAKFFDMVGLFSADLDPARIITVNRNTASVAGTTFVPVAPIAALRRLRTVAPVRSIRWAAPPAPCREAITVPDRGGDGQITQARLWYAVRTILEDGDILVPETGTPAFGIETITLPAGTVCVQAPLWGAIGYATPAAFGAGVARPDRRVVLITGDGSLQLTAQEISRMLATGQAPVIIVVNNGGYTVERAVDGRYQPYNDIDNWRYTQLPAVFNREVPVDTHLVSTEGELAAVFEDLHGRPRRPVVVEVVTDPWDMPGGMPQWGRQTADLNYREALAAPARLPWSGLP